MQHDFGWENRFCLVGPSSIGTDFRYIPPNPADAWAGCGGLAGTRTLVLTVWSDLASVGNAEAGNFMVDLVDVSPTNPPLLEVRLSGRLAGFDLRPGADESTRTGS